MVKPTLLVLAAGMGSRYGSLKQMDGVGPNNEAIIDYSVYDAIRAGFGKVVFVIRHSFAKEFQEVFSPARFGGRIDVEYVFQELDYLPEGLSVPEGRVKPWGTNHAVMMAADAVHEPFAVINADDFYGRGAFEAVYRFLKESTDENAYCMAGYRLRNTLTENGSVARGVCEVENGLLTGVTERTKIFKRGENAAFTEDGETFTELSGDALVSMNFWGFTPHFLDVIWERFPAFLDGGLRENPMKCEFYLPSVVNSELQDGRATVCLLPCDEVWHGVTYKEDLESVVSALAALHREGVYPPRLWE